MNITYAFCNFILKFGTIEISKQNYKIIDSHLNNLDMRDPLVFETLHHFCDNCDTPDSSILPDAEIYVQKA